MRGRSPRRHPYSGGAQKDCERTRRIREVYAHRPPSDIYGCLQAEDIHHFVELELVARIADLGFKLHRPQPQRTDATELRLFVREKCASITGRLRWVRALTAQASGAGDAVMPAYTHLQRAEPVLVGHWLRAYGEMLLRDVTRLGI